MVTFISVGILLGFSVLWLGLLFLTEEQSEETEGAAKPAAVAEEEEKDRSERDNSEGKNSNKDSGKMLASFTFLSYPPPHALQSALSSPPPKLIKSFYSF